jgi:glycerophosphoryl diester phosphodiesterase
LTLSADILARPFAHRGLWRSDGAPENSKAAFEAACRAGYGIELDVQVSSDGEALVFHDDSLERMTEVDADVWDLSAAELKELFLFDGPETIPTLSEVLSLVAGRSALLIELKAGPGIGGALESRVAGLLDRYAGPAAVISFEPDALGWFARHRPYRPRGLDAMGLGDREILADGGAAAMDFERALQSARPDFLVLETDSATGSLAAQHRANELPVIAWTVRSVQQAATVAPYCDSIIFEGFPA